MKGTDFVRQLPAPGPERERKILQAVADGHHQPPTWCEVPTEHGGRTGSLYVSGDALMIGDEEPVRVNATHATAERIARHLGCYLPTAKISDLVWQAADHRLEPCIQPPDQESRIVNGFSPSMCDAEAMLRHHRDVEAQRAGRAGLLAPVGKDWVDTAKLDRAPSRAANYGWHSPSAVYQATTPDGGRVWQPVGTAHGLGHVDYSQVVRLVRSVMLVDGRRVKVADVAADPDLCWLVSSETTLDLRHPGVESDMQRPRRGPARMPLFGRTLRAGMVGEDVRALQVMVGAGADGIFGPKTRLAVMRWQDEHGLVADGIVGPRTRRKLAAELSRRPSPGEVLDELDQAAAEIDKALAELGVDTAEPDAVPVTFDQAANFTWAGRDVVHWIVLHSMEAPEKPSTAEAVARWAAGRSGPPPRASWHWAFDSDSAVQCVKEEHVGWHANGANRFGAGYEHAGYARQSRGEWLDDYSEAMLWLSAKTAAEVTCPRWRIPVQFVDADGLRQARERIDQGRSVPEELRGFTYHSTCVDAGLGGSHRDPGPGFPIDAYLRMVREAAENG